MDRSETTMTLKRVEGRHFRSYWLTATNDVGRRRALVELERRRGHGTRRRPFPGGGGERQTDDGRPTPRQDAASALRRPGDADDRHRGTTGEVSRTRHTHAHTHTHARPARSRSDGRPELILCGLSLTTTNDLPTDDRRLYYNTDINPALIEVYGV